MDQAPMPDYAADAEREGPDEWSAPAVIARLWAEGTDDDRREIDRILAIRRRDFEPSTFRFD